jgi:hypothetical protein
MATAYDIVSEVAGQQKHGGKLKAERVREAAVPRIDRDREARLECIRAHAWTLAKHISMQGSLIAARPMRRHPQGDFFDDLAPAFALDLDESVLTDTVELTMPEWKSVLAMHERKLGEFARSVDRMKMADRALTPYWEANPHLRMGQVIEIYRESHRGAAE